MPLTLICLFLSVTSPLEQAKKHFEAGKVDDVFLDLEHQKLPASDLIPAADLLTRASRKARDGNDNVMAMSLADLALKLSAEHPGALEEAAAAARSLEQFAQAEAFAERWIKAQPQSVEARLCRAELALEAGEWQLALDGLTAVSATGPLGDRVRAVQERAAAELKASGRVIEPIADLRKVAAAAAEARQQAFDEQTRPVVRSDEVIIYSTQWCGVCRGLRAWLKHKGIGYIEKDIEHDAAAAAELAAKAKVAGLKVTGVPVIDARGTMLMGFNPDELAKSL